LHSQIKRGTQKIAACLSTWDAAIEAVEEQIELATKKKKALMQKLLTGEKRLPGFEWEWSEHKLGDVVNLGTGQSAPQGEKYFNEGNHCFLRVSDIGSSLGKHPPTSRDKVNEIAINENKLKKIPAGSTIFTKSGASLLLNQRAQLLVDTYMVSHLGYAKAKGKSDDDFVYYLFCSIDFSSLASGTSLPALKLSSLANLKITIPDTNEQKKISYILSNCDEILDELRKKLSILSSQKRSLMQQLLRGQG
jgi:type I restriction enzyme S subunit